MVLPVNSLRFPFDLLLQLFSALTSQGGHKSKLHLYREAAPLCKNLFQYPLELTRAIPVYHGILHRQGHQVLFFKSHLRFAEHGILDDTVMFQFQKQAVLIHFQKLFRRILPGKTVFFLNLHSYLFVRKQLIFDSFFQVVDILFVYEPRTFHIDANRASISGGGDLFHLRQS